MLAEFAQKSNDSDFIHLLICSKNIFGMLPMLLRFYLSSLLIESIFFLEGDNNNVLVACLNVDTSNNH